MIICYNSDKITINIIFYPLTKFSMAEAGMAAYGSAIGVAIALAVVTFALRGKGHPDPAE